MSNTICTKCSKEWNNPLPELGEGECDSCWVETVDQLLADFNNPRFVSNIELIEILTEYVNMYPDMRFGQILQNFGFIKPNRPANPERMIDWQNEFYVESDEILKRVKRLRDDHDPNR